MKRPGQRGPQDIELIIVGSIGIDTIRTPKAVRSRILGGSVSYACIAASFFTKVGMVGVVGDDFPNRYRQLYRRFRIDLKGLQQVPGRTFRWSGVYARDMNNRRTLRTELNVFAGFKPELPPEYRAAKYLFLANISPELQLHVLEQVRHTRFVAADTMDLWINTARKPLMDLIGRVQMLTLNDAEAKLLTGEDNLVRAARHILRWGPDYVVVKKGEHGAMLFTSGDVFVIPAFPIEQVIDPTGAGDAFAGGFMGGLARMGTKQGAVRRALAYGSVLASFGVEAFGLDRLVRLKKTEIEWRLAQYRRLVQV